MTRTLSSGPNGTPVGDPVIPAVTFPVAPLNFDEDFLEKESGLGKIIYTDITSPQDRPCTLRISQLERPNVYTGSSIDPSVFLPNKKGTDTVIEVKGIAAITDSVDSTFLLQFPYRFTITTTVPDAEYVTPAFIQWGVSRCVAALFAQGDATIDAGAQALLHGVVKKD